jgi:hypothetical protein
MKNSRLVWVTALLLFWGSVANASSDVPPHLTLARQVVDNIQPEDNTYVLGGQIVKFPGDLFSSKYSMRADCSGFLQAIFQRANYFTHSQMAFVKSAAGRTRHTAEDFVLSIETEKGFKQIKGVQNIQPGDLLAHTMLNL